MSQGSDPLSCCLLIRVPGQRSVPAAVPGAGGRQLAPPLPGLLSPPEQRPGVLPSEVRRGGGRDRCGWSQTVLSVFIPDVSVGGIVFLPGRVLLWVC